MHGYTSGTTNGGRNAAQTNMSNLQDYADYNMYNMWVPCTALVDHVGTALVSSNSDASVKLYPDAAVTSSCYSFRKPKHWVNGVVSARVHYTGLEDSGNDSYIGVRFEVYKVGDVLGTGTYGYVATPSPTLDNSYEIEDAFEDMSLTTYNASILVRDPDRLITLSFTRDGKHASDTYTFDFELIGLEVFYREYKHTSYNKVPGIKWTS